MNEADTLRTDTSSDVVISGDGNTITNHIGVGKGPYPSLDNEEPDEIIKYARQKALLLHRKVTKSKAILYSHGAVPLSPADKVDDSFNKGSLRDIANQLRSSLLLGGTISIFLVIMISLFAKSPLTQESWEQKYSPLLRNNIWPTTTFIVFTINFLRGENRKRLIKPLLLEVQIAEAQLSQLDSLIANYKLSEHEIPELLEIP